MANTSYRYGTIEVAESARHARQRNTEMPRDADSLPINLGVYLDKYDCV